MGDGRQAAGSGLSVGAEGQGADLGGVDCISGKGVREGEETEEKEDGWEVHDCGLLTVLYWWRGAASDRFVEGWQACIEMVNIANAEVVSKPEVRCR